MNKVDSVKKTCKSADRWSATMRISAQADYAVRAVLELGNRVEDSLTTVTLADLCAGGPERRVSG